MKITKVILSVLLLTSGVVAFAQDGEPMSDAIVIDGGTVHPVSGEPFVGRVVVEGGLITAVGADAMAPEGAAMIDDMKARLMPSEDDEDDDTEDTSSEEGEPAPEVSWGEDDIIYSCRQEVNR
jgi:hypothetical protein